MNKCKYCGHSPCLQSEFCSEQCEKAYMSAIKKDKGKIPCFLALIVLGIIIMFVGVFMNSDYLIAGGCIFLGLVIFVLPLATPETMSMLGYLKAKTTGRICGAVLALVGIYMLF